MPQISQRGQLTIPAGATVGVNGPDIINSTGARGIVVVITSTAIGTGSVTVTVQGKDSASATYYTLLAGAPVTTNTQNVYFVFPGATVTANVSANAGLPEIYRVITTANNANAATYTVGWSTLA